MQCFPAIMSGSHVLASAPTGSGKTIAFLGPILALLAKPGKEFARALVVDPSRELAKQTLDEFAKLTSGRKWNGRLVDKLSGDKAGKHQASRRRSGDTAAVGPASARQSNFTRLDETSGL